MRERTDMESIDRLRQAADELAQRAMPCSNAPDYADVRWKVKQLADAIEREAIEERTAAYNEGYDAGFASADDWAAQHEDAMAEHGWIRLPVDADGVPIHIGDVIAYEDNTKPKEVVALVPPSVVMVEDGPRYADMCRHYHAPTVEDVLREFAGAWAEWKDGAAMMNPVETFAAKLRLAGDE